MRVLRIFRNRHRTGNAMNQHHLFVLKYAHKHALQYTGCTKVAVGSAIVKNGEIISLGANRSYPNICHTQGCLRVEKYGENSKNHRNPDDCRALHSEIDAIARTNDSLIGADIYVTRYPCEACARAIVASGIKTVIYGRQQVISPLTKDIFRDAGLEVIHADYFDEEDVYV